jgi:hypothetical protein
MSGENKEETTLNKGIAGEERSSSEPELTRVAGGRDAYAILTEEVGTRRPQ